MPQGTTYLELSEDNGSAHKFYEVTVAGSVVSIRYGRIGGDGQLQTSTFPTPDKAEAAAAKKIGEKVRKGYAPAVPGQRAARSITRRAVVSAPSSARRGAPVLWRFRTGSSAFGIHIDEDRCWVGNQNGDVYTVSHGGEVQAHYRLPEGVKCLVADDFWIYAGCDDGTVYDLSAKIPFAAYKIAEDVDIFWLDIRDGVLGVSDADGGLTVIDHEDEFQWSRKSPGQSAWMVRCDDRAVYHGHRTGVTAYANDGGRELWHTKTTGGVLFGWQERESVYAGTGHNVVQKIAKASGAIEATYQCDSAVYSCATAADGRYVFAGDNSSSVYCFSTEGTRLWKLGTGCGSALSMQYRDERLYIVTTDGSLACVDATDAAIEAAKNGTVPTAVDVKLAAALPARVPTADLATTTVTTGGVVVECIDDRGRPRMRVTSPGYQTTWNVQFPQGIRQVGSRYVVEQVLESGGGGFYRVRGEIKRLL
ncbi:MAG TPA: WGR domain-containing protein [Actinocrinis sp.]|nr:WGR domain-containing protein [Actinocrinis sp.]